MGYFSGAEGAGGAGGGFAARNQQQRQNVGETLQSFLSDYGAVAAYALLFFYSFGGGFVGIVVGATLASVGRLDIAVCVGLAVAGNFIGAQLLCYFARFYRREIYVLFKKRRRELALSRLIFGRYGGVAAIFTKFIYGLKTLIPIAIGFTGFSLARFAVFNAAGALAWGAVFGVGGFVAGEGLLALADKYGIFTPLVLICIVVAVVVYFRRATRKKPRENAGGGANSNLTATNAGGAATGAKNSTKPRVKLR